MKDYFLELFSKDDKDRPDPNTTADIQTDIINTVHACEEDPSYRSLLLHAGGLQPRERIDGARIGALTIVNAAPQIEDEGIEAIGDLR